jgi:hypothetical protein
MLHPNQSCIFSIISHCFTSNVFSFLFLTCQIIEEYDLLSVDLEAKQKKEKQNRFVPDYIVHISEVLRTVKKPT